MQSVNIATRYPEALEEYEANKSQRMAEIAKIQAEFELIKNLFDEIQNESELKQIFSRRIGNDRTG